MFDLNAEPSVNSRQYSSGLDYPYLNQLLKSVDYDDRLIRNQRAAVVTIDNSLSEKAIELSLEDPRRAMYTRLKRAMMSPDVRAALYLMTNTSKFSRQSRGHDTLRLSHLEHFIELLDSENNFPLSKLTEQEFLLLKKHLPKFSVSSGVALSKLDRDGAYRHQAIDWADYQRLKKELRALSSRHSSLSQKDKLDIRSLLHNKLLPPRKEYLETRLKTSLRVRLGNRFLFDLERDFREVLSHYDFETSQQI